MAYEDNVIDTDIVDYVSNPMNLESGKGYTHETIVAEIIKKHMGNKEYELIQVENSFKGFMWCIENGVNVLNVSYNQLSGIGLDYTYEKSLENSMKIIVSAGNAHEAGETQLATKDNYATAVAAVGENGEHLDFSSWGGGHVDIACMGKHYIDGKYRYGTSYASPVATAITAMYDMMFHMKRGRYMTMKEQYDFYKNKCIDIDEKGKDLKTGFGWLKEESLKGGVLEVANYPEDIKDHWAEEVLKKYIDLGILKGYPDGTIRPDRNVTLAEMITILDRL